MATIIYQIYNGGDQPEYAITLDEAKKIAREQANYSESPCPVNKCQVINKSKREIYLALLTGGWCAKSEIVFEAQPRKKANVK